jgi:hypothetical protein
MSGLMNPDRTRTRLVIREPLGFGYTIRTEEIGEERVSRFLLVSMMLCQTVSPSLLRANYVLVLIQHETQLLTSPGPGSDNRFLFPSFPSQMDAPGGSITKSSSSASWTFLKTCDSPPLGYPGDPCGIARSLPLPFQSPRRPCTMTISSSSFPRRGMVGISRNLTDRTDVFPFTPLA